jgi:hypothetical protein
MEQNEGKLDRTIRFFVGIIALYLSMYSYWWLILAVPALITASNGFCWPYKLLGINTNKQVAIKVKSKKKKL